MEFFVVNVLHMLHVSNSVISEITKGYTLFVPLGGPGLLMYTTRNRIYAQHIGIDDEPNLLVDGLTNVIDIG